MEVGISFGDGGTDGCEMEGLDSADGCASCA